MILESGGRFCVGAFGWNLVSFAVKMFSHLNYSIQAFYRCTFNAICKDIVAISFIILQHKTNSFPSTLMGHTTLVLMTAVINTSMPWHKLTQSATILTRVPENLHRHISNDNVYSEVFPDLLQHLQGSIIIIWVYSPIRALASPRAVH
jgi:hypothetical protein